MLRGALVPKTKRCGKACRGRERQESKARSKARPETRLDGPAPEGERLGDKRLRERGDGSGGWMTTRHARAPRRRLAATLCNGGPAWLLRAMWARCSPS